jgi:citrate lyase subunit beta / citryl-CoA lyase
MGENKNDITRGPATGQSGGSGGENSPGCDQFTRVRRSRLYIPGNNPNMIQYCGVFGADGIVLDLEDSVAPDQKDAARVLVRNAIGWVDFKGSEKNVRVNALSTPYIEADIDSVVPAGVENIMLPKVECPDDVTQVDRMMSAAEKKAGLPEGSVKLTVMIETPDGVANAFEIARASKRIVALTIGGEDYTASVGGQRTKGGRELLFVRAQIVNAAKAAGVQALDTVFADVDDAEGLRAECKKVRELGFDGKALIHPRQIEPVNEMFTPNSEEIVYAERVVAAIEEAKAKGLGVVSVGRKMVDRPVEMRARRVLALAGAAGIDVSKVGGV